MNRKIFYKNYDVYFFDVENDCGPTARKLGKTHVYLAAFINENSDKNDENCYFYDMGKFLEHIHNLSKEKNICICVYNLKYEWSFIQPYLTRWGFTFKNNIEDKDSNCYNVLCSNNVSRIWCARIKFDKTDKLIYFKDFLPMFNCKLKKIPEMFGLSVEKGEIDYNLDRSDPNYIPTTEEKHYCFNDVKILCEIAQKLKNDSDFWNKCTISSSTIKKYIRENYGVIKPYEKFRAEYPRIKDNIVNELLEKSFHPALAFSSPEYQFKTVKNAFIIDMHQSYPSSIVGHNYPFGNGFYLNGKKAEKLYKKDFKNKNNFRECILLRVLLSYECAPVPFFTHHLDEISEENEDIVLWNEELDLIEKTYIGVKVKFLEGVLFFQKKFKLAPSFAKTFEKRKEADKNGDIWTSKWLKLSNNSGAGKFLEHSRDYTYVPAYDEFGMLHTKKIKNVTNFSEGKYSYYPVGTRIVMWSRIKLFITILKFGYENLVYCDTDCVVIKKTPETLKILNEKIDLKDHLGGWGYEDAYDFKATMPKRYRYKKTNGEVKNVIAGITNPEEINDIESGYAKNTMVYPCKYDPKCDIRYSGGAIVCETQISLKVDEKYREIYEKNHGRVV